MPHGVNWFQGRRSVSDTEALLLRPYSRTVSSRLSQAFLASCVVLVAANLLGNLWLSPALYLPGNAAVALLLLWLVAKAGAEPDDLGLKPEKAAQGLKVGATVAALVVGVLLVGVAIPATRNFFEDERAADMSLGILAYHALLRIPLGTAVFEELAFRGVLYGLGKRLWSAPRAALVSSALFGLWHIAPLLSVVDRNAGVADTAPTAVAVIGGVLGASIVGLFLIWVRERADSLVAPIVVHAVVNSVALVIAYLVV